MDKRNHISAPATNYMYNVLFMHHAVNMFVHPLVSSKTFVHYSETGKLEIHACQKSFRKETSYPSVCVPLLCKLGVIRVEQ